MHQNIMHHRFLPGLFAGLAVAGVAAVLMGQGASTSVKSDTQYFVTGEGDDAHLWVREGVNLRCVGHGACAAHAHGDANGHGHDHAHDDHKDGPAKP